MSWTVSKNLQLHLKLTCASQERTTSHPTRRWSRTGTRRRTDTSRCRGRAGGWRRRSEKQKQPVKRCPPEINVLLLWHSARDLPQCSEIRVWPVTATRCGGQAEARCAVTCSGLPPPYAFRSCGQSVCHSRFCLPRLAGAPNPPGVVPSADSPWIDLCGARRRQMHGACSSLPSALVGAECLPPPRPRTCSLSGRGGGDRRAAGGRYRAGPTWPSARLCHSAAPPSPSILKHLLMIEGGAAEWQSLADG